jgi:hypothetical protein
MLLVTVLIYDDPLLSYSRKEFEFYRGVTHVCLKEVLDRFGLQSTIHDILRTSSSMLKSHYSAGHATLKDKITEVSMTEYEVNDVFAEEYAKTRDAEVFGNKVAKYIKGWWGGIMEGSLINLGIENTLIKEVVTEFFENALPAYAATQAHEYPEKYKILALTL